MTSKDHAASKWLNPELSPNNFEFICSALSIIPKWVKGELTGSNACTEMLGDIHEALSTLPGTE